MVGLEDGSQVGTVLGEAVVNQFRKKETKRMVDEYLYYMKLVV